MILFNTYKRAQINLPERKRKVRFIAWIKVSLSYIAQIVGQEIQFWEQTLTDARMTPQIIYLEKFLNDRYGTTEIRIVEGYEYGPYCWYSGPPAGEIDMFMIEPDNYCYSTVIGATVDFVVQVPRALESECNVIAAYVTKYKLAGKIFIIQLI